MYRQVILSLVYFISDNGGMKMIKLTERFYILKCDGLKEVKGKKIKENYAITKDNINNVFTITHIPTGTSLSTCGYKKMKDCIADFDYLVEKAEECIEKNPQRMEQYLELYKYCMENNLIEKLL